MDSGSGSLQSSSGGEEEYDSRAAADTVSAFMTSGGGGGTIPNEPAQQFFDPFSNYLQLQQNPNPNPTLSWPRTTFMSSFQQPSTAVGAENHHTSTLPPPPPNQNHTEARNPKKRSRASRRAPTTVLTTDTSNFRAMVQEFTGIPAPPFTNSPFPRSRLDLFGTRSTSTTQPPPLPQYLRRSFPQKPQPTPLPFLDSSFNSGGGIALDGTAMAASSSTTNNNITSVSSSPAINNQTSNLFTISNPLFNNSFLQTNLKFQQLSNPTLMGSSKTQNTFEIPSNAHQSESKFMGFDEQFGLSHENHVSDQNLTMLPDLIPSDQNNHNTDHGEKNINLSSINGGYNFRRNTTNFHGEKGPENGVGRGEGMVESWICSSE